MQAISGAPRYKTQRICVLLWTVSARSTDLILSISIAQSWLTCNPVVCNEKIEG